MPVIIPPGYAQATFTFRSPNFDKGVANVILGYQRNGTNTLAQDAVLFITAYNDSLRAMQDNNQTLTEVRCVTDTSFGAASASTAGSRSSASVPPNVCLLTSNRSDVRGPRGRGRTYWPGLLATGDVTEDGTIIPGILTEAQAHVQAFQADLLAGDATLVILQHDEPEQKSPPLPLPPEVEAMIVSPKVATQRRRLR